jgi:prevent-host-death family protein
VSSRVVVTVRQAKTQLSKLISRAEAGDEIIIARGREPAVKLTPVAKRAAKRRFGALKGKLSLLDAFFFDPTSTVACGPHPSQKKQAHHGGLFSAAARC